MHKACNDLINPVHFLAEPLISTVQVSLVPLLISAGFAFHENGTSVSCIEQAIWPWQLDPVMSPQSKEEGGMTHMTQLSSCFAGFSQYKVFPNGKVKIIAQQCMECSTFNTDNYSNRYYWI